MKEKKITLCFFIDAFGWEIFKAHRDFLADLLVDSRRLRTILGYSSACDPSIISGMLPQEHRLWSSFYYSPQSCPYKWVRWLKFLPKAITDRSRIRHLLSRAIKGIHGFTGYFQIYHMPFEHLPLFDYAEKKRIWSPGGLPEGKTIFDHLNAKEISYYVGDLAGSDERQLDHVKSLIESQKISFAYLLLGQLDGLMHAVGTKDPKVTQLIRWYDQQIRILISTAEANYEEVSFFVFSDHGMHEVRETYDLQAEIGSLGLDYGVDYVAIYDSTMARFWYLNDEARKKILSCLGRIPKGRVVSDEELQRLGVYFADRQYGETIFLMDSGVLINPSFMGLKKIAGMHGYHPDDLDSYAMIGGNRQLPEELRSIEQIFTLISLV